MRKTLEDLYYGKIIPHEKRITAKSELQRMIKRAAECEAKLTAMLNDEDWAEKLIPRNPSDACRLPSAKAREMQVLSPEEILRLLIQAKEDGCHELLLLELASGLRRGEICALQWDDLNLRTGELRVERQVHRVNGELTVSPPKTKASNHGIILPAPILNVLKTYREQSLLE